MYRNAAAISINIYMNDINQTYYYKIFKTIMFLRSLIQKILMLLNLSQNITGNSPLVFIRNRSHEVLMINKFKTIKQSRIDKDPILQNFDNNENHWDDFFTNNKIIELFNVLKEQINFTIQDGKVFNM